MAQRQLQAPDQNIVPSLRQASTDLRSIRGIIGEDRAVLLEELSGHDEFVRNLAKSVGLLNMQPAPDSGGLYLCTTFLIGRDKIVTAMRCLENTEAATAIFFPTGDFGREGLLYDVKISETNIFANEGVEGYALITLDPPADNSLPSLELSDITIKVGDRLGMIYFRYGRPFVVWDTDDCVVLSVSQSTFYHSCDAGPGTYGGPVFDLESGKVVGVHVRTVSQGGLAYRLKGIQ